MSLIRRATASLLSITASNANDTANQFGIYRRGIEQSTYKGVDATTGLTKRSRVGGGDSQDKGHRIGNQAIRVGDDFVGLQTEGLPRFLTKFVDRIDNQSTEINAPSRIVRSPQPMDWLSMSVVINGATYGAELEDIEGYLDYVNPPFATPANFLTLLTNLDFLIPDLLQVDLAAGSAIAGAISLNAASFAGYTGRRASFRAQFFSVASTEINAKVTITQGDNLGGVTTVTRLTTLSTGIRQPNGLYLAELDDSIFTPAEMTILQTNNSFRVDYELN